MLTDCGLFLSVAVIVSVQNVGGFANGDDAVVVINGTLGDSVWLPYPQPLSLGEIRRVQWILQASHQTLAQYQAGKVDYFGSEEMRNRVAVHTENLTVQISDLQLTDTGVYRVETVTEKGIKQKNLYNLTVFERVTGVQITSSLTKGQCNGTLTCDVKSGKPVIFVWERDGVRLPISQPSDTATLSVTLSPNDSNTVFKCKAGNPVSEDSKEISFQDREFCVMSDDSSVVTPLAIAVGVSVLVIIVAVIIVFIICKKRTRTGADTSPPVDTVYAEVSTPGTNQHQNRYVPVASSKEITTTIYSTVGKPGANLRDL